MMGEHDVHPCKCEPDFECEQVKLTKRDMLGMQALCGCM